MFPSPETWYAGVAQRNFRGGSCSYRVFSTIGQCKNWCISLNTCMCRSVIFASGWKQKYCYAYPVTKRDAPLVVQAYLDYHEYIDGERQWTVQCSNRKIMYCQKVMWIGLLWCHTIACTEPSTEYATCNSSLFTFQTLCTAYVKISPYAVNEPYIIRLVGYMYIYFSFGQSQLI